MSEVYGYSSIIDVRGCDPLTFTRDQIEGFLVDLCGKIDMDREDLHFWDYEGDPDGYEAAPTHLRGVSAVQFIKTSSIIIHTLDDLQGVFIDLFSCKRYDPQIVERVVTTWFGGRIRSSQTFARMV